MRRQHKVGDHEVIVVDQYVSMVSSSTEPRAWHTVTGTGVTAVCDCNGFTYRDTCSHVKAMLLARQRPEPPPVVVTRRKYVKKSPPATLVI